MASGFRTNQVSFWTFQKDMRNQAVVESCLIKLYVFYFSIHKISLNTSELLTGASYSVEDKEYVPEDAKAWTLEMSNEIKAQQPTAVAAVAG